MSRDLDLDDVASVSPKATAELQSLRQQLEDAKIVSDHNLKVYQKAAENLRQQLDTAWAQAHRLALELECLRKESRMV